MSPALAGRFFTTSTTWEVLCVCTEISKRAFQLALGVKNPLANAGDIRAQVQSLGWEDSLEKEMATHSSVLAWRIPWTEEPGGLQPMGSQRVRHE